MKVVVYQKPNDPTIGTGYGTYNPRRREQVLTDPDTKETVTLVIEILPASAVGFEVQA